MINITDDKNRLQVVAKDEVTANMTHTLQPIHFGGVTTISFLFFSKMEKGFYNTPVVQSIQSE